MTLQLVRGEGAGDGRPAGALRLVGEGAPSVPASLPAVRPLSPFDDPRVRGLFMAWLAGYLPRFDPAYDGTPPSPGPAPDPEPPPLRFA